MCDQTKARTWRVSNPSVINPVTNESVGYKLVPFTRGASQPVLLTGSECAVTKKGEFATKNLWVTPHDDSERFPAGEFTPQGAPGQGLPKWTESDRSLGGEGRRGRRAVARVGVAHVPRPEDFPCMNVEHVGFSFKPDGFFQGKPRDRPAAPDDRGQQGGHVCGDVLRRERPPRERALSFLKAFFVR